VTVRTAVDRVWPVGEPVTPGLRGVKVGVVGVLVAHRTLRRVHD
jgi:hypothetical protein